MQNDPPRSVIEALRVLMGACLDAAETRPDVRKSLHSLGVWLVRETSQEGASDGRRAAARAPSSKDGPGNGPGNGHGVLTPAARGRSGETSRRQPSTQAADGERITAPLSIVVTRARWKAAACRLSLDRYTQRAAGGAAADSSALDQAASSQLDSREVSLRARLDSLADTSTWMLDMPFGKRVTDEGAFEVDPAAAKALGTSADCYETIATGAEIAMELDEAGAFADGPSPGFLYLLAEAQSALLQSLAEAPTRSDSDQRDVFLWLKAQTTSYRIYVDRFMRLDDPADPTSSKDLTDRLRRASREILERFKSRRVRRELVGKIRYHAQKLSEKGGMRSDEVSSLNSAIRAWRDAGFELNDRKLIEIIEPLVELNFDESTEAGAQFAKTVAGIPLPVTQVGPVVNPVPQNGKRATGTAARSKSGNASESAAGQALSIDDVRAQLANCRVGLLHLEGDAPDQEDPHSELCDELGAKSVELCAVSLGDDSADERARAVDEFLGLKVDLFLLGVKLPKDEYASFKQRCLDRDGLFVRLPGQLDAASILHQVSRQVGWRLRARAMKSSNGGT